MDNWADLNTFCCGSCICYVPKGQVGGKELGRCRRHAPDASRGWSAVYATDWCYDHKLKAQRAEVGG